MGMGADRRYFVVLFIAAMLTAALNGIGIVLVLNDHPLLAAPVFIVSVLVVGGVLRWSVRRAQAYHESASHHVDAKSR